MRDPIESVRDVLDALDNIERYTGRGREAFENDELLQSFFLLQLQIIGEAVASLPPHVTDLQPDVPWRDIVGMRNILVHGYFAVDTEVVWQAVTVHAPPCGHPSKRF